MTLGLAVLVACQPTAPVDDADPDGTITANGAENALDPQLANPGGPDVLLVFEPPLRLDPKTLRPVPGTTQLPNVSADGLTYRLTVREDSRYSDGTSVRARDLVYGITRLCDPSLKGPYASVAYLIVGCAEWSQLDPKKDLPDKLRDARAKLVGTGVRLEGDRELSIRLTQPATYFAQVLTLWSFAPVRDTDVSHGGEDWTEPKTYIGNGPFVLSVWEHNRRMVFTPNRYYRDPPKIKQWTKVLITEPAVALSAYRHGELDVFDFGAGSGTTGLLQQIQADPSLNADLRRGPSGCTTWMLFNTRRAPFDDPVVRLAFAKALDRDAYIRDVLGSPARPAVSLIPPGLPGNDAGDLAQQFDPPEARRMLSTSTYGGTEALRSIVLIVNEANVLRRQQTGWLRSQWAANLGVTVTIRPVDSVTLGALMSKQDTIPQIPAINFGWCADYPDQQDWLTLLFHSESQSEVRRLTGFSDPEFDRAVSRADVETDTARRNDLYQSASRVLSKSAPVVFLFSAEYVLLQKGWVRDPDHALHVLFGAGRPEKIFVARRGR